MSLKPASGGPKPPLLPLNKGFLRAGLYLIGLSCTRPWVQAPGIKNIFIQIVSVVCPHLMISATNQNASEQNGLVGVNGNLFLVFKTYGLFSAVG